MFESIKRIFKSPTVLHVRVEGTKEVTLIEYIGNIEKDTNSLKNLFDLLGYEIRSDTIEIFNGKKCLGRGYIADIAGITVDISRVMPEIPKVPLQESVEKAADPEGLMIAGQAIIGALTPDFSKQKKEQVPCVILIGETRIDALRFQYLRSVPGAVIDDENKIRYEIALGTKIEITMPDGNTGPGYVCDHSGCTVKIKRDIKIIQTVDGKDVEVGINWSGRIGKHATSDKLTKLLMMASGRENLVMLILVALIANIIGVVLRI